MANTNENLIIDALGGGAQCLFDLPVAASTHVYAGTLMSQLTATGGAVPYSTASTGVCVGVSQHEADNSSGLINAKRILVESRRMYAFTNGGGGDAFADTDLIGALVYGTDDHTVAKTSNTQARQPVGFFYGMQADGKVRVFVDPPAARIVALLQALTDTPATADVLRDNIVAAFG